MALRFANSIRLKLILFILSSVGALFIAVSAYSYIYSKDIIVGLIQKQAKYMAMGISRKIEGTLYGIEKVAINTALYLGDGTIEESAQRIIPKILQANRDIYGMAVALEPYSQGHLGPNMTSAPYWSRNGEKIQFIYLTYDYTCSDWYILPRERKISDWSDPYYDTGGGEILMITYSVPLYRNKQGERIFLGVVTADVSLDWLRNILASLHISERGYAFLVSRTGTFISHPDAQLVMNETLFTIAEARADSDLRTLGRRMIQGESGYGVVRDWLHNVDCWLVFQPLAMPGWSLGIFFPQDELLSELNTLHRMTWAIGFVGGILLLGAVVLVGSAITRPLRELSKAAGRIAEGDFQAPLPVICSRDEIATLTTSFAHMQTSLAQYMERLATTVAEKQRIESELAIAREIQMGILPKIFPPFPDRKEFDIFARLQPAREVGGDFYDFFFTDKRHFWVAVGDVSGKGIPASLFMAVTKTMIKAKASGASSPGAVLSEVNRDLSADNPSVMFVTLFLGLLDTETGRFTYANGGHPPPYLIHGDGTWECLPITKGLALGVHDFFSYRESTVLLRADDLLLLYTDGITEAANPSENFFQARRLEAFIQKQQTRSPKEIVEHLLQEVAAFSAGAAQTDDITVMALRFQKTNGGEMH